MVRWKIVIGFIALGYICFLFLWGIILMIQMGPGEIYYYDLNGRTHPDIHYHTIYPKWIELWFPLSLLSLPALFIIYFLYPSELKEVKVNE